MKKLQKSYEKVIFIINLLSMKYLISSPNVQANFGGFDG